MRVSGDRALPPRFLRTRWATSRSPWNTHPSSPSDGPKQVSASEQSECNQLKAFLSTIFILLFHFWLCWVFVAVLMISLAAESRGYFLVSGCRLLIPVASLVMEPEL